MGRVRKSINEKLAEGEQRTERLTTGKRHTIDAKAPVGLTQQEAAVYNEVVAHLNDAGAGMNIDLRLICAYCKDVIMLDALQEQMKVAVYASGDDAANEVKRLNAVINGTHQRIFQNQQSLGIGNLNRRKISHFQDDLSAVIEKEADKDPLAALLGN